MNVMLSNTFFPQHPKAGEPTGFKEKVKNGTKRHTCRCNYEYWKDRIARLQERGGVLSIRQWSGKPYQKGSTTEIIMDVPASMVEVQQLVMVRRRADGYVYSALLDGKPVDIVTLAKNDGLTLDDFKAFFNPVFDDYEKQVELQKDGEVIIPTETALKFAVIHFTTFRY